MYSVHFYDCCKYVLKVNYIRVNLTYTLVPIILENQSIAAQMVAVKLLKNYKFCYDMHEKHLKTHVLLVVTKIFLCVTFTSVQYVHTRYFYACMMKPFTSNMRGKRWHCSHTSCKSFSEKGGRFREIAMRIKLYPIAIFTTTSLSVSHCKK